jgi:MFS family permease
MLLSGFTYLGFFAVQNTLQLYLIGAILGIGRSAYNLGLITLMMDRVPSTHYGSAMGLYGLAEDVGGMLGSIIIGSIYDIWGMPTVLYFLFSDMITNALVSLIAFKKFHYKNKK